jgi:hypothetical protein
MAGQVAKMNSTIPADALVLVVILPSPRDLEIARLFGWYRIPLRWAPKVIDVDYLAFYQTNAFGEGGRWQIQAAAEVLGHELTTRAELLREEADHPRANEEYYKIQIGSLIVLPKPVQAGRWRRITFLYTTGAHLNNASTLNELVVKAEERQLLWSNLRERAAQAGQYQTGKKQEEVDLELLALLDLAGIFEQAEEGKK